MKSNAILSSDRVYRYLLTREWDETLPKVMFIGLNPSTADENKDDPTIRRCISFAKSLGYGGFYMTNLFAYRSTKPEQLWKVSNPIGDENDGFIEKYAVLSDKVIVCWGNNGAYLNRSEEVMSLLSEAYCFSQNKTGEPKHPLYVKSETEIIKIK